MDQKYDKHAATDRIKDVVQREVQIFKLSFLFKTPCKRWFLFGASINLPTEVILNLNCFR